MDPDVKLKRHTSLWESAETNARRVAVAGVIFAALILINVVEPYKQMAEEEAMLPQWRTELAALQAEQAQLQRRKQSLAKIESVLDRIEQSITATPWQSDINALIQRCRGGCPANVQTLADNTIRSIAGKMKALSVVPLRSVIQETGMVDEFGAAADSVETVIDDWEEGRLGTVWYATIDAKERTAASVGAGVRIEAQRAEETRGNLENATTEELANLTAGIDARRVEAENRAAKLREEIQSREEKIRAAMDAALPAWATGLFTVKSMVLLYPWILVGIGLWMVANGLIAGKHFRGMADAEGWNADERSDPLLSSPWTLTWRGVAGGAVTFLCYGIFLGALAYCIYRSEHPDAAGDWTSRTETALLANFPPGLAFVLLGLGLLAVAGGLRPRSR